MLSSRLHYRWSQLEADRTSFNIGSPVHPLPKPDRILRLHPNCKYQCRSKRTNHWEYFLKGSDNDDEEEIFAHCADLYSTIHYHTFHKDGGLKLTEVELYFMSQYVPRSSASQWAVIYLGIGDGERFRYLRDTFFPGMWVIAFDPAPDNCYYTEEVQEIAERWTRDGTNFYFYARLFDLESDVPWILEKLSGKRILLISDIRSEAVVPPEECKSNFAAKRRKILMDGIEDDNKLQMQTIHALKPVSSLVKFKVPDLDARYYKYLPGRVLIQTFLAYLGSEVRLIIDGVPTGSQLYDAWEIHERMKYFHEHMRGQVYETPRPCHCTMSLDSCFDCSVLIETVSQYATKNFLEPGEVLRWVIDFGIYKPGWLEVRDMTSLCPRLYSHRFWEVATLVQNGLLIQAVAALEHDLEKDEKDIDWADIAQYLDNQPDIAKRILVSLPKPCPRHNLISLLCSLSVPFTLVKTQQNGLHTRAFCSPWPLWQDDQN